MATFFDSASLALIPSGVKESKVYSIKPTDGSGDLAFSRSNDTATRVNSSLLLEKVRTNLVLQSETFDNAYWTKQSGSSVTANSVANPINGAITADTLTVATTTNSGLYGSGTNSGNFTQSIYAKKNTIDFLYFVNPAGTALAAWFNLANGTVGQVTVGYSANIESVGNGWYRCSIRNTATQANNYFQIGLSSTDGSDTPAAAGSAYIFGAQSELSDFGATDYIATTSAAVSVGPVANLPRLDYTDSTCPKLLLEPQRVNLALYSEQADNGYWGKYQSTITANDTTSPDGYTNADKIVSTAANAINVINRTFSSVSGGSQAISLFVKAGTSSIVYLQIHDGTSVFISDYDLSNSTTSNTSAGATAKIEAYAGGWYRCSLTATTLAGTHYMDYGIRSTAIGQYAYIFGMQFESLSSYATSYINTLGAAVTRGADACSKTGISSLIGQTEGTLCGEFTYSRDDGGTRRLLSLTDGGTTNRITTYVDNNDKISIYIVNSSSEQVDIRGLAALVVGTTYKYAIAYKLNDVKVYVNGVEDGSDTSATIPSCSQLYVGSENGNSPSYFNWNQVLLFPTRLTNAELATLTTI